ncbi:MAG: Bug family tripartite tricarboxylate transporter substrate binding protein [Burkholderiales bacterium]
MHRLLNALVAVTCLVAWTAALPQSYPTRPVRFIIPTAPGGGIDFMARLVGPPVGEALGQPIVLENRGGLGGQIGAGVVAKAAPDGYTVLISTDALISQVPVMKLPYDPFKDLEPVALLSTIPYAIVVNPEIAKDIGEFVQLARSKANAVTYGTPGVGSPQHMIALMFGSLTGSTMLHIPYKGAGEIVPAVMGGQVHSLFQPLSGMVPNIKAGKLRALAVTVSKRVDILPDVPTIMEAGYPELNVSTWFGAWVPAGTPREITMRLQEEMIKAVQTPTARDKLAPLGFQAAPGTGEQLREAMKRDLARWSKAVKDFNIRVE